MKNTNISVLMSVYNQDKPDFLRASLDSLYNQTLKAEEIIIVLDGLLEPELHRVIDELKLKLNIITIQNFENLGLAKSLNIGLKMVKCDLVARMDADDIAAKDRFEKQYLLFNRSDIHSDVVGGYVQEFNGTYQETDTIRKVPTNVDEIIKFSKYRSPLNHPTVMMRTKVLRDVGGYPEKFNKLEDYALWINILQKKYILRNIPEVLTFMRISDSTFKRRGGLKQAKAFINFRTEMLNIEFINVFEWTIGILISVSVSLMPSRIRGSIYKLLRK